MEEMAAEACSKAPACPKAMNCADLRIGQASRRAYAAMRLKDWPSNSACVADHGQPGAQWLSGGQGETRRRVAEAASRLGYRPKCQRPAPGSRSSRCHRPRLRAVSRRTRPPYERVSLTVWAAALPPMKSISWSPPSPVIRKSWPPSPSRGQPEGRRGHPPFAPAARRAR